MNNKDLLQAGYRYALSLIHHRSDAEDLVQEAWVKLMGTYGLVTSKSLFFTAIRTIYIDKYRRSRLFVIDSDKAYVDIADPVDELEIALSIKDMEKAMAELRGEEREALYLNIVEGYSAQEIAQLTGGSRNTILSLIYRGKQKLFKILAQQASPTSSRIVN